MQNEIYFLKLFYTAVSIMQEISGKNLNRLMNIYLFKYFFPNFALVCNFLMTEVSIKKYIL